MRKLLIVLPLLLMGCASHPALPNREHTVYQLRSGDIVKVTVFGQPDLSGEYRVNEGFVAMPLSGAIHAEDTTARDLEKRIEKYLVDEGFLLEPRVSVEIVSAGHFYILGEVANPGWYQFNTGLTIKQAIALAGGFTYRANLQAARVTDEDQSVCVAPLDAPVYPGDTVEITERYL
jgi:protein involved in polysaccharide export with SLBB domain